MKIACIFILSVIFAFEAFASNAVLLTSLKVKERKLNRIEREFRNTYRDSGLNLVVHHRTTPEILNQVLTDSETEVVIWVSHAAGDHPAMNGMEAKGVILDFYGNNVKNFFTTVPSNLKFLGLVGCSAQSIFDGFKERGNYDNRPNLEIMSFDTKVELFRGLRQTLQASLPHLDKELQQVESVEETVSINVDRFGDISKSWLEMGDKVIAFMDEESPRLSIEVERKVWDGLKKRNIKLVRDVSVEHSLLDALNIEVFDRIGWKRFALPDGTPIGSRDQHLYLAKP